MLLNHKGRGRVAIMLALAFAVLALLPVSSFAAIVQPFSGNVSISSNSSTDGALVGGYIGSSLHKTTTTGNDGAFSGKYILDFYCNAGEQLFITVWGITASHALCGDTSVAGNASADL